MAAKTRLEMREEARAKQEAERTRKAKAEADQLHAMRGLDWSMIDGDWKAGIKAISTIADDYHKATGYRPSVQNIINHYAVAGIPRDLSSQITVLAQAKAKQAGGELLTPEEADLLRRRELDEEIIEANAATIAGTLIGHRRAVKRYQALSLQLLAEIEAQTFNIEDLHSLGAMMRSENERGVDKLNDIYHKIIATPGRVDAIKKLAETSKVLIGLERQALGIADNANGDANRPPDGTSDEDMTPKEVARRVAFMLLSAEYEHKPKVIDVTPTKDEGGFDMDNLA